MSISTEDGAVRFKFQRGRSHLSFLPAEDNNFSILWNRPCAWNLRNRYSIVAIKMAAASSSSSSYNESDAEESSSDDSSFSPAKLDPKNAGVNVKTRKINARSVKGRGRENRLGSQSGAVPSTALE